MRLALPLAAFGTLVVSALLLATTTRTALASEASASPAYGTSGYYAADAGLTPSQRAGREIWYKATAGNDRFHTYVFQQRIGVLIDWYRVLNSRDRDDRFAAWGLINDPNCCTPGSKDCPAGSLDETYGFDWCPGDEQLLRYVGKSGYRDPACDFKEGPVAADAHGASDQRQSSCDLAFGTSTGALGLRKFPNPRFDAERWRRINKGKPGDWTGYNGKLSEDENNSDSKVSHLLDASIEPPFRIGMACGACHIAFDPLNPPDDPAHPKWENIKGAIGNQYARISEVLGSGMPKSSLEWQVFAHARPGATDTSAVPTDQVNNPGTQNALINIAMRPTFDNELVNRWHKQSSCPEGAHEDACWCEPGRASKCWEKSEKPMTVHHVLKGGGDSVGIDLALQRVYINIGSCSEACWVNHLTDLRQLDPQQRNYGQTPFDIGQCRRDCPNFRAIEDRIGDVINFLTSPLAVEANLLEARANEVKKQDSSATYTRDDLIEELEQEFGTGAVSRGRVVFAENCARCHSSQDGPVDTRNFYASADDSQIRIDWLGNDDSTAVSEVGTFRCRSLHSNHLDGHVWDEFSSTTYKQRPPETNLREAADGGRGYYRNLSLVNTWAHAPFMHNNGVGPELCGQPKNSDNDFFRKTYVDGEGKLLATQPECFPYDPSVKGRFELYKASMQELLNPDARIPKITQFDEDIVIDIGPRLWDGERENQIVGMQIVIPAGTSAGLLGNFQYKQFIVDLVRSKLDKSELERQLQGRMSKQAARELSEQLSAVASRIVMNPSSLVDVIGKRPQLLEIYSSCNADVENAGHEFGGDLPPGDKQALTAFLATL